MEFETILRANRLMKKYEGFTLDIPALSIPKGFVTTLVGENGAGKSTLLSMLSGVLLQFDGDVTYFGDDTMSVDEAKGHIGYQSTKSYFLPGWTIRQAYEANVLLFPDFHKERFDRYIRELDIPVEDSMLKGKKSKPIRELSDGNQIKLILAGLLSRDTRLLLLDEPASPLDPLMREKLCDMLRKYIEEGEGERSVFLSSHNVSDMESVTDYLMIMEQGQIVEQGFVEELKEKYVIVKGEDFSTARDALISWNRSKYGYEGLAKREDVKRIPPADIEVEVPDLTQISVGIMKKYSTLEAAV